MAELTVDIFVSLDGYAYGVDSGREPIFAGHQRTAFELAGSKVLDSRLLMLEYRPVPG